MLYYLIFSMWVLVDYWDMNCFNVDVFIDLFDICDICRNDEVKINLLLWEIGYVGIGML